MKFSTIDQLQKAFNSLPVDAKDGRIIPVMLKKATVEFFDAYEGVKRPLYNKLRLSPTGVSKWRKNAKDGLYDNLHGVSMVSRVTKQATIDILQQLESEREQLDKKIALIKQCRELGLKVEAA